MMGADTKFWEDVNFSDNVGPVIKGTLSVREQLVWLMVTGSPFLKAHKNELDFEAKYPRFLEYVEETEEAESDAIAKRIEICIRNSILRITCVPCPE